MKKNNASQQGMGLIEILVVIAIIGVSLVSLTGLGNFAMKIQHHLKQNMIASFLASEAIEATRAIKDGQWATLASLAAETPLHPIKAPSLYQWTMESGEETIDGFTRQIVISPVYRDGSFDIADSGTLDPDTKKIIATVSWTDNGQNRQVILTDYLMNWQP